MTRAVWDRAGDPARPSRYESSFGTRGTRPRSTCGYRCGAPAVGAGFFLDQRGALLRGLLQAHSFDELRDLLVFASAEVDCLCTNPVAVLIDPIHARIACRLSLVPHDEDPFCLRASQGATSVTRGARGTIQSRSAMARRRSRHSMRIVAQTRERAVQAGR